MLRVHDSTTLIGDTGDFKFVAIIDDSIEEESVDRRQQYVTLVILAIAELLRCCPKSAITDRV